MGCQTRKSAIDVSIPVSSLFGFYSVPDNSMIISAQRLILASRFFEY